MKRTKKTQVQHLLVANPERVAADQERRRSGAAGRHDSRPNRQRSRRDAQRAAIREYA